MRGFASGWVAAIPLRASQRNLLHDNGPETGLWSLLPFLCAVPGTIPFKELTQHGFGRDDGRTLNLETAHRSNGRLITA